MGLMGIMEGLSAPQTHTEIPVRRPDNVVEFDEMGHPKKGGVMTGTTIMAVKYDGGVIMGADSRTSMGSYVSNRVSRKITQVHDKIFVCRSGSAADTQAITGIVKYYMNFHEMDHGSLPLVKTAAWNFKKFTYEYKDRMMAGMIVGGWDPIEGPQVYSIPLGGAFIPGEYAVGGSGSIYLTSLIEENFKKGMKKEEAIEFVRKCVGHAMYADGSSGGLIRMMDITADSNTEYVFTEGETGDSVPAYGATAETFRKTETKTN